MIKTALIGTIFAAGLAFAAPAQADGTRAGIQFGNAQQGTVVDIKWDRRDRVKRPQRFDRRQRGVNVRQIRRQLRRWGCYDISQVRRKGPRLIATATCDYGTRLRMVFHARTGELLRETVIGYDRVPRGRRGGRGPRS